MKLVYATSIAFSNKLANRVQVHSMSKQFQKKLGENFYLGVNYKNVDDKNINIICFNTNQSYKLAWRYLKFIKDNHRQGRRNGGAGGTGNINYIYCREARLLFFIILFNKLFFHLKLQYSYEIHAITEEGVINKNLEKVLSSWANKIILITRNLKDIYIKKYKAEENKIMIAPDGVDLEIFDLELNKEEARRKLDLPLDKKIISYLGKFKTMGMDKGISDIMKAIKILDDRSILFIAIGGSEEEIKYYSDLSKELSVSEQVKFIGLSPQEDLALYQKAVDVLLMPFPKTKHYMYYMSPLKMFEYMAGKRPIVATDLPSVNEVLNDGNAIMVKPDNPESLANGIKRALEEENLVNNTTEKAFQDVKEYTWERRVERILGFIK